MLLYRFFSLNTYQQLETGFPNHREYGEVQVAKRVALNETKAEKERKANVLGRVDLISSVFNDYDRDTSFKTIVVNNITEVKNYS